MIDWLDTHQLLAPLFLVGTPTTVISMLIRAGARSTVRRRHGR